jgi:hypothetical protein
MYPHIGDLTNLTGYPPLKLNIIFCDYLLDHNLSLSMDHQYKEDCKLVPRLKISSISPKEKYFRYLPYLYHLFARGWANAKHGGGGTYNAILEFKGEQIKKWERERKKKKKNEYKEKKKIYVWEKEKIWVRVKNKIKWAPRSLKCIRNFKDFKIKIQNHFSNHVQSDNEDFLCASRSLFAICTCPPISSMRIFLSPSLI